MIKLLIPFLLLGLVLSTADFLVNLQTEGGAQPFVEVERFHFGSKDYTIMFHAEFDSVSGTKRVIQFNGENTAPVEDDKLVIVQIVGSNKIGLCFGRQENYQEFNLGFNLNANDLHSFAISVSSVDTQNVNVVVYVNGAVRVTSTVRGKVAQGFRTGVLGAEAVYGTSTLRNFMNGLLDNVVVISQVLSQGEISTFHNVHQDWAPNSDIISDINLWIHFNDAVQALTNTAVAVTNVDGANAEWVTAHIHDGVFLTHGAGGANWRTCSVTGDPHYYDFYGAKVPGGEQLIGHYIFQTCDNENYEVRTHTRMCAWWANTVFRVVTLRYKDFIFRLNQDETGDGATRAGWTRTNLGLTAGRYIKHVSASSWTAIGSGTWTHQETGARYSGATNGNMIVIVPDVAKLDLRLGDNRYINIYLTMNLDRCTERRGACDRQLYNQGHVLFTDLIPTALPDIDTTGANSPCDNVDSDILLLMTRTCSNYYPSGGALYEDCLYDACASGDAEMVPSADMTPECQLARLTGLDNPSCTVDACPNACSGRGSCVDGACVCDPEFSATWGGFDCGQKNQFMCHAASYGSVELNIQPRTIYKTADNNLVASFHDYAVQSSLLIYPSEYDGSSYLQFIASSQESESSGSFTVCVALESGAIPTVFEVVSQPLDVATVTGSRVVVTKLTEFTSGELCVNVEFGAYSFGGFYIDTAEQAFTVSVKNMNNLQQVLVASENGRGGMDVSKIPSAHFTGFSYVIRNCDNANCHQHDENCEACYQEEGCGFCMETQRCLTGNNAGPARGICRNWRVSLDEDVSRVVTVKYNGDDLVDPDYEVFLSSLGAGSTVPVDVLVPTGRTNNNIDIQFMLSTAGSYALNAGALKTNLLNSLHSLQADLNLGTGFYGNLKSVNTLTPSVVDLRNDGSNNLLLFGRALSSPTGLSDGGVGGQFNALVNTIADTNFRRFARKIVALTVYDMPANEDGLEAARNAALDNDIFTVFVIPKDVSAGVVSYWTDINNRLDGIPSIVVRVDKSGSDLASAFRTIFTISSSFPHVVIRDISGDAFEYNHVDLVTLANEADALSIRGLINSRFRARFVVPMKKGDNTGSKIAKINVHGIGHSLIEDVPSTGPTIAADRTYTSYEDETLCVEVTLDGSTYKNLFAPLFEIVTLPNPANGGTLNERDCSKPNCVGAPVTPGLYAKKVFCFTPDEHDHSTPAGAVYNSFTYRTTDGCTYSEIATISVNIIPRYFAPQASDISLQIFETEQSTPLAIDITAFEADLDDLDNSETVSYSFSSIDIENYNTVLFGAKPTNFFHTQGSPIDTSAVYGPYIPVNWYTTQTIQYVAPNQDIFGRFVSYVTLTDNHSPTPDSNTYRIQVDVVPVNDAPTAISVATGFDATGVDQFMKEDTVYSIVITGEDIDSFGIGVDIFVESNQIPGSVVGPSGTVLDESSEWYTDVCRADAASRSVVCSITVSSPSEWNSCDVGEITGIPDLSVVQSTCYGPTFFPAVTLKYRVNDHNDLWGNAAVDNAPKTPEYSVEGVVNLHVLAVNDAPFDPPMIRIDLIEDDVATNVDIEIEDIDSLPVALDVYIRNICADYFTLTQQSGSIITVADPADGTVIEDVTKRNYFQLHRFLAEPYPDVHGGSRDNDWLLCQIQTYAWDGELPSQGDGIVNIHVRPVNDAPYDLATEFTKYEDYESIYSILDLTASDVDSPLEELTYTITQIPRYTFQGNSEGEGVTIHIILENGEISHEHLVDEVGCEFCLPYTVQLNSNNEAKVYVRNIANWYGTLSGEETLKYTVTDVDSFLLESDEGYIVNTVESTVDIEIRPVNDKPIVTIQPPSGAEDVVQIVHLTGLDPKFGEDDDLTVTIEDIQTEFSDDFWSGSTVVFYHFDSLWYDSYLADPTVSTDSLVELLVGDEVDDWPFYRVLFVPPQDMNIDASATETPLFIRPSLKYRMVEIDSHAEPILLTSSVSDYVYVTVTSVNDVPVTWGAEWETLEQYDEFYGGFSGFPENDNGQTNYDNTKCVDDCYYLEDFGSEGSNVQLEARNIYFGGRDVEGDDLRVVIRTIDCKDGANFTFITNDNTHPLKGRTDIKASELVGLELGKMIEKGIYTGYELTNLLAWSPAFDDWNEVNPNEVHANYDITSFERDSYCTITYVVIDEEGVASDSDGTEPKTITLTVRQVNDQPQDSVLSNADTTSANLIGYENKNLKIRIDAFDKENDDFDMYITSCEERGSFYYPSANQANFIAADGSLTTEVLADLFDMSAPVDCTNPTSTFNSADADNKGWYILFVPVESDFALEYNAITVAYDDNVVDGQEVQTSTRNIKVLPVNDAPVIEHAEGSGPEGLNFAATLEEPVGLGIVFGDIDAPLSFRNLGFRLAVTKIDLFDASATYSTTNLPYEYTFVPVQGVSLPTLSQWINDQRLGYIQWRSDISKANLFVKTALITFRLQGTYEIEVVAVDNGMIGYCSDDVVFDGQVYPEPQDVRNIIGTEGTVLADGRCNRVTQVVFTVSVTPSSAVIGGVTAGAGAGLLAVLAIGAVIFAKLNKPEDLNAWEALDNAQITNAHQSGIHEVAMQGGQSALYQGKN